MLGDADSDFSGSVFLAVSVWYGKSQPGSLFACLWMLSIAKTKKKIAIDGPTIALVKDGRFLVFGK